jgi:hypothetical protein
MARSATFEPVLGPNNGDALRAAQLAAGVINLQTCPTKSKKKKEEGRKKKGADLVILSARLFSSFSPHLGFVLFFLSSLPLSLSFFLLFLSFFFSLALLVRQRLHRAARQEQHHWGSMAEEEYPFCTDSACCFGIPTARRTFYVHGARRRSRRQPGRDMSGGQSKKKKKKKEGKKKERKRKKGELAALFGSNRNGLCHGLVGVHILPNRIIVSPSVAKANFLIFGS